MGIIEQNAGLLIFSNVPNSIVDKAVTAPVFPADTNPIFGFCLGHQLLGEVIGGKVIKSSPPEIGILDVNLHSSSIGGTIEKLPNTEG